MIILKRIIKKENIKQYAGYRFSNKELVAHIIMFAVGILIVAKLFYGNFMFAFLLLPFYFPMTKIRKDALTERREKIFKRQFSDAIVSMSDAMKIGCSAENAVKEAYREMRLLHGANSYICKELLEICRKISINTTIETAFVEMATRTKIREIELFSQIFSVAKRTGGNIVDITAMVSENINQCLRVEQEIYVAISEKRLEQRIMSFVPIGIILYTSLTSEGFLDVMYTTILGKIIMTVSLIVYGGAVYGAERIIHMDI